MSDETTPAQPSETPGGGETPQTQDPQPTFDSWLAAQDEATRGLIDSHTGGLRSALETERTQRKELAKQLKDLSGKLDANSDAAKQLGELTGRLEESQNRADFYEAATAAGCTNLRLAWLAYQADEYKSLDALKSAYPALFATPRPPATNAGAGARQQPGGAVTMNDMIRRAAGRT